MDLQAPESLIQLFNRPLMIACEAMTAARTIGGARTTYGALTIGLNIKLPVAKPFTSLTIRPELRVDHAFDNTHPFNDSTDNTMFTAALDAILTF